MTRVQEVSRLTLLVLIAAELTILGLALAAGQWTFLVALAASLGSLAWASWYWGGDSRDGRDWSPRG